MQNYTLNSITQKILPYRQSNLALEYTESALSYSITCNLKPKKTLVLSKSVTHLITCTATTDNSRTRYYLGSPTEASGNKTCTGATNMRTVSQNPYKIGPTYTFLYLADTCTYIIHSYILHTHTHIHTSGPQIVWSFGHTLL